MTTKFGELYVAFVFVVVVTALLTAAGWGLFQAVRGLAWTMGVAASYVGAIGWIIAVPLVALAIYETISRFKPNAAATPASGKPGADAANPWRGRTRGLLCAGSAAVIMSGNLCLNIAAARIDAHYQSRRQQGVDIYKNHDLAKLVGQCVRLAILRHADLLSKGDERSAIESVAAIAPDRWAAMTDETNGRPVDTRVLALADAKLTQFIQEPKAEALNQAVWVSLLTDWRSDVKAAALTDTTLSAVASTIAKDFGITLREALKADFEKGGRAWAAMQLDMMSQLLVSARIGADSANPVVLDALLQVNEGLGSLDALVQDVRRAGLEDNRQVLERFYLVEQSISALGRDMAEVKVVLMDTAETVKATSHDVQELRESDKSYGTLMARARAAYSERKLRDAASFYEAALKQKPEDFPALEGRCEVQFSLMAACPDVWPEGWKRSDMLEYLHLLLRRTSVAARLPRSDVQDPPPVRDQQLSLWDVGLTSTPVLSGTELSAWYEAQVPLSEAVEVLGSAPAWIIDDSTARDVMSKIEEARQVLASENFSGQSGLIIGGLLDVTNIHLEVQDRRHSESLQRGSSIEGVLSLWHGALESVNYDQDLARRDPGIAWRHALLLARAALRGDAYCIKGASAVEQLNRADVMLRLAIMDLPSDCLLRLDLAWMLLSRKEIARGREALSDCKHLVTSGSAPTSRLKLAFMRLLTVPVNERSAIQKEMKSLVYGECARAPGWEYLWMVDARASDDSEFAERLRLIGDAVSNRDTLERLEATSWWGRP